MDKLTGMRVFVAVVNLGSLTAAAGKLEMSRSMATRHLASLEKSLGVKLLSRNARKLQITSAGEDVLPYYQQILSLNDDVTHITNSDDSEPQGLIRVACSVSLGQSHIAKLVRQFVTLYPKIQVELTLTERNIDLAKEPFDMVIQVGRELDPRMVCRQLTTCDSTICAAPSYLEQHNTPTNPSHLVSHNCLLHTNLGGSLYLHNKSTAADQSIQVSVSGQFKSNDVMVLLEAAIAGEGITCLPSIIVQPYIDNHQLTPLLEEYVIGDIAINIVYQSRQHLAKRAHKLLDFLVAEFAAT
ncbi:LysR family transcriptional regulator [Ferrimonas lipolytica]|uniref:LysR family transcriptional regulator n=1 Tax=Ferrimonas lipolytica TaxID=2724191 RepID=A0A6H1UD01_9GAMM|nr:LysR family transcriptional regulator [Ferrimonas lipolytica]QIZ76509.1 LysR family transcriptional regulator [Ferrimonas lipolytica]